MALGEQSARPEPSAGGGVAVTSAKDPVIPDFVMIRPIGRGSYGDVWLARGLTGVYRAIKVVWRDRFANAEPFEREFKGLKKFTAISLPDSGQLALLHVGQNEADGFFYYVMELADDADTGREVNPARYHPLTLREVRDRRNRLPPNECVAIGIELARALAGLHSRGLVHRDVKPSNVIMVGGVPKLADIGLVASTADARTFVGTAGYVPPEGPGRPSADVFALGRIIYELATGLDREDYPRLPGDLRKMPDRRVLLELNEIILKSCDPEESRRYRDGPALLEDLLEVRAGRSIRLRRSRARVMRLAAVSILILATAVAGYWWKMRPAAAVAPDSEARQLVAGAWERMNRNELGPEDLELADGLCKRASGLDPTDADVWAAWSQVNSWYVGFKIDQGAGRREAARSYAERAVKLAPNSYEARLAQACYLIRVAPFPHWSESFSAFAPEADRLLRQLLEQRPDEPRALRAFGALQLALGHLDEARAALARLARGPPFAAWAWLELAELERRSGSVAEAEGAVNRSIAIEPLPDALKMKVIADLFWEGDPAAAKASLGRIPASLTQDDPMVWTVYSIYYGMHEPDKLLNYLQGLPRDWIHGREFNGPTALLIGNAHWIAGRKDAARMEWRAALELVERRLADQPTDPLLEDWKGVLLGKLGEYAEAEKCLQLAADMAGVQVYDQGDLLALKIEEGKQDAAMDMLEQNADLGGPAARLRFWPLFDPLRNNPRFKALLAEALADPGRSPNAPREKPAAAGRRN